MGMAASQARFLGLTARKSNVEYQGQQVNQQRTALANESANLYNQMMTMDVPTPPATTDYYKTTYELENSETALTSGNYTIGNISKSYDSDNPNLYNVSLNYQTKEIKPQGFDYKISKDVNSTKKETEKDYSFAYKDAEGKITTKKGDIDKYSFYVYDESISQDGKTGGFTLTMYGNPIGANPAGTEEQQKNAYGTNAYTGSDGSMKVESGVIYKVEKDKLLDGKDECCPNLADENYYFYKLNGNTYFMTENELKEMMNAADGTTATGTGETDKDGYFSTTRAYTKTNDHHVDVKATLERSSTGRYSSINIIDDERNPKNLRNHPYDLNAKQVFDQEGYDNAMNDYNFQKDVYEKAIADINAKTEIIQKQDQNLELRLDQLDTEQNAIKTEMDAVTKVLRDNVEKTFKTFNA